MGSLPEHAGGMLILLVTEENRIEIEFSDSLGHVFDADWCHELLYTEVVPFFKEDKYADGLERILIRMKERLMDVRGNAPGAARKKGRRRAKSGALLTIFGAYATRAYWRNLLFGGNNGGGGNHPPEGDDGDSKYLPPRAGKRGGRRLYGRGRRQRLPAYEEEYRYNPPPNSSSFLHGLGRLMGLATGRTKIGPTTKSAGNNINIVWKPAPPNVAPPPYIEATRTATTTTTVNQEDVAKPIIGQSSSAAAAASSGQDTTATTLPPEPSDQKSLRSHPGTFLPQRERLELEAKKRAELEGKKKEEEGNKRIPWITPGASTSAPSDSLPGLSSVFGVLGGRKPASSRPPAPPPPKDNTPPPAKEQSSGAGGGASWFSGTRPKASATQIQKAKSRDTTSTGKGGGATWSNGRTPKKKTPAPTKPQISKKKTESHKSSSNGGGASW